ncbi:MAG: YtfJ family protein [Spirochaetia bacterium]|nr:YtfJ family protein [Spirochaetia bacterium]
MKYTGIFIIFFLSLTIGTYALNVGDTVNNVSIKDANNKSASIPDLGKKTLTIFYTDPDVKDQNDPFADYLKAANLPKTTYRGMGIVNLKDTWLPNSLLRTLIREKIKKYNATILTDTDRVLKNKWNLGSCDDKSIVIVIDKNRKVLHIHKGAVPKSDFEKILNIIKKSL